MSRPNWDTIWIEFAQNISRRSIDPKHKVSLRSFHDHVDVSEIAKSFKGGGHRKAAGFTLSKDVHIDDIFDA